MLDCWRSHLEMRLGIIGSMGREIRAAAVGVVNWFARATSQLNG
jgi:hypothetical protein